MNFTPGKFVCATLRLSGATQFIAGGSIVSILISTRLQPGVEGVRQAKPF
jgi:hypothetical protein